MTRRQGYLAVVRKTVPGYEPFTPAALNAATAMRVTADVRVYAPPGTDLELILDVLEDAVSAVRVQLELAS